MPEELIEQQQVPGEVYPEHSTSHWPQTTPVLVDASQKQIELRIRIQEHLEKQKRLEAEIARQAEEKRIREEQIRLEEERKRLEEEVKAEKSKGIGDPILISLIRRAMPNLIAYDVCGVQPMTQPTGLIFAMKSKYEKGDLFQELDTDKQVDSVEYTRKPDIHIMESRPTAAYKDDYPNGDWCATSDLMANKSAEMLTNQQQAETKTKLPDSIREKWRKVIEELHGTENG